MRDPILIGDFQRAHGLEEGTPRTVYLTSGRHVSGTLTGWSIRAEGNALAVNAIQLRLPSGDVIAIPWHAVEIVAAGEIEGQS